MKQQVSAAKEKENIFCVWRAKRFGVKTKHEWRAKSVQMFMKNFDSCDVPDANEVGS